MLDNKFQLETEQMYSNNQLIPRIRRAHQSFPKHLETMLENDIDPRIGFDVLIQMVLHKRAKVPVLVGLIRHHFEDQPKPAQAAVDFLDKCVLADLVDFIEDREEFVMRWDVSESVHLDIAKYQYPMPMVVQPLPVKDNTDSGYLTIHESIILKDNHHENDVCLDHINRMNRIPLTLDQEVARMIQNKWKGLDLKKPDETFEEWQQRIRAFQKYDTISREVMEFLDIYSREFWLTHAYDKRGRTYCRGYHVNYQGNPWNKAVINFAHKEVVEG